MNTTTQKFVLEETTRNMFAWQIIDLVQAQNMKVEAALVGWDTPINDNCGLFVHFTPLEPSKLNSFANWGRDAGMVVEYSETPLMSELVYEIKRRWPDAVIYSYGCRCCDDSTPRLYF